MIAREITKLHETFYRDNVNDIKLFKTKIKGELTVVISEKNIKDKLVQSWRCNDMRKLSWTEHGFPLNVINLPTSKQ